MDHTKESEDDDDGGGGGKHHLFFIEGCSSSEGEGGIEPSHQIHRRAHKQAAARASRETSPPLLLAFSVPPSQRRRPAPDVDLQEEEEEEEDTDQPIEEWMILGREEQVGDSSIQLNLSFWNNSEDDSGDEDQGMKSVKDMWAVSEKDKYGADQSLPTRYFVPGRSLICNICNRTGHLAKICYYHKSF